MRIVYGASEDFRLSTSAAQDTQCLVPLAGASLLVAVSWEILLGTRGIIRLTTCCCKGSSVLFFWPISLPGCGWLTTVGVFLSQSLFLSSFRSLFEYRRLDGDRTFACGSDADGTRTSFAGFAGAVCAFHLDHQ